MCSIYFKTTDKLIIFIKMFQEQLKKPKKVSPPPEEKELFRWNRFQANYEKKHQADRHPVSGIAQLPIGQVKKISLQEPLPAGWRKLRLDEGKQYKSELGQLLDQWSIVGFEEGAMDGQGYGYNIREERGAECGELFILKPKQDNSQK